jgi:hypothetical protein
MALSIAKNAAQFNPPGSDSFLPWSGQGMLIMSDEIILENN